MEALNRRFEIPSVTDRLISLVLELPEEQQHDLLQELKLKLLKERRRHIRDSILAVVDFVTQGRAYREFAINISKSGVYIQVLGSFSVGQDVSMILSFPGSQEDVKINGRIARVDDTGIGVEF